MTLRCSGCRQIFKSQWNGDVLQIMCRPCTNLFTVFGATIINLYPEAS